MLSSQIDKAQNDIVELIELFLGLLTKEWLDSFG